MKIFKTNKLIKLLNQLLTLDIEQLKDAVKNTVSGILQ